MHRSEEAILVTTNQVDRALIQPESFMQLQRSGMRFIHMGVIQVRVQILHRQEEGTLLLIVFRDNRWQGDQAIFATMEVDLTQGSQLVYVVPDTMLTISDFYRNIQISILARGYEGWQNGEANILVTRGMVGRLSNTPNVGFAYEIQNVVDYLFTHGVRALPGRRYNTREVQGQNWIIHQSSINIPMQPTEVNTRNLPDGRVSIHFDSYQTTITANPPHYNQRDEEILSDEDEVQHQVIAVLLQDPDVLQVRRISSTALLPQRKTEGSAGYDLTINREQFVPKRDKSLLTTGVCIQIPKGTYARIAPRSSAALRGLIIMGGNLQKEESKGLAPPPRVCTEEESHPECPGCAYCHDGEETAKPYEFYVTPSPGYIDDREYIEYLPSCHQTTTEPTSKDKQTFDESLEEYQQFCQESDWLYRRAMVSEDDPMEIAISSTRQTLRRSRDYRQELQQQLDALTPSSSTNHYGMTITSDTDDDYIGYLQYLALQDSSPSTEEFTNPFAEGGGKMHIIAGGTEDTIAGGTKDTTMEEEEWITDYPKLKTLTEQIYSTEVVSRYRPPMDTTMNLIGYPPTNRAKTEPVSIVPPIEPGKGKHFKSRDTSEWWNLPSAHQQTGAILTLPT
ncbi:hypothetical protein ZIOFF_033855 [Zingiber officinale]|uniref:dUTP diphosphatase n=1 Tax=Zingiber officinale TaxID=94328 RepID=A0A8J5GIT1_ZINOF|nr:hypothetical protein ZIOFF_033855 [Zingiber officinale]